MKSIFVAVLLLLATLFGYQGQIYSKFQGCLKESEDKFYSKEFASALAVINELRDSRWYWPIKTYPSLDILEMEKELDYQKGRIFLEQGNLKDAYASFEKCTTATKELAAYCLYQQGNVALYQGNVNTAEKKWQASMAKSRGGHDFDAQVNLELLKNEQKKSNAIAAGNMLTHRRGKNPSFFLRPPNLKAGPIKP